MICPPLKKIKTLLKIETAKPYVVSIGTSLITEWRLDGPDGPLHRDYGPARELVDYKEWWTNGVFIKKVGEAKSVIDPLQTDPEDSFQKIRKLINNKTD